MSKINTVRKICKFGTRELRVTEINGEEKYDIRRWNGDEPEDGVRFSAEELLTIGNNQTDFGNGKLLIFDINTMEWGVQIIANGVAHKRMFASDSEFDLLKQAIKMLEEKEKEKKPVEKKATTTTKKSTSSTTTTVKKAEKKPAKVYENGYEKFKDQFEEFRNSEPENRRAAYESTHNLVLAQIKERCKEDAEYNKACLLESKNSQDLSKYCLEKQFERYDVHDYEELCGLLKEWIDEYILKAEETKKKK